MLTVSCVVPIRGQCVGAGLPANGVGWPPLVRGQARSYGIKP